MIPLAERWADGVEARSRRTACRGTSTRLGSPRRVPVRAGPAAERQRGAAAGDFALERFLHLHALNRGILLTPFHNMALMSPATTEADVDRHTEVFREAVQELTAG